MTHLCASTARRLLGSACGLLAPAVLLAGCAGAPPTPTTAPAGLLVADIDAIIYEVRVPPARVGELDAEALSAGQGTPADFQKLLEAIGRTKVLYRMDQAVKLAGDQIKIATREPVPMASRVTQTGQRIHAVMYRDVGAILKIAGWPQGDDLRVHLSIELSSVSDSAVKIARNVPAVAYRRATLTHNGPVRPGRAFAIVSVDASSRDAEDKAVGYVARVVLGKPQ